MAPDVPLSRDLSDRVHVIRLFRKVSFCIIDSLPARRHIDRRRYMRLLRSWKSGDTSLHDVPRSIKRDSTQTLRGLASLCIETQSAELYSCAACVLDEMKTQRSSQLYSAIIYLRVYAFNVIYIMYNEMCDIFSRYRKYRTVTLNSCGRIPPVVTFPQGVARNKKPGSRRWSAAVIDLLLESDHFDVTR